MRIGIGLGLGCALLVAGCAPALHPVVRQSSALGGGLRTVALAPAPPDVPPAVTPDRDAIGRALKQAGFTLRPTPADARYLLVVSVAGGPRRVGTLLPPAEGAPAQPVLWVARPSRGPAGLGPATMIRVGAIIIDAATGRELWRATLAGPRTNRPDQVTALATRLLAELPRDQAAGGS